MTSDESYYQRVSDIVDRGRSSVPSSSGGGFRWLGRGKLKRALRIGIVSIYALLAVLYAADYIVLRLRMLTSHNPFGSVQIDRLYAIQEKGGKTEFDYGGSENQTCVHSLLPHLGYSPCWYLSHKREKRINL
jgi:hypothetical protein